MASQIKQTDLKSKHLQQSTLSRAAQGEYVRMHQSLYSHIPRHLKINKEYK